MGEQQLLMEDSAWLNGDIAVLETAGGVGAGQVTWRCSCGGDESDEADDCADDGEYLCRENVTADQVK